MVALAERAHKKRATHTSFDQTVSDVGHLLRRAGFGAGPADIHSAAKAGIDATVASLINFDQTPSTFVPPPDSVIGPNLTRQMLYNPFALAAWWVGQMVTTPQPLQEKMTLFWHGHFATSLYKVHRPDLMYQQNQLFRTNGLGRFDDLLSAVYKDPAMLIWLDGRLNFKQAPNENFGREVMELFTLGRGNYTEDDVHASSRSFTGWRLTKDYQSTFVPRLHDDGSKTLLGQTGNWGGEDAVRILAAHSATGPFLATKLWRFFASDSPPANVISKLAKVYYDSDHVVRIMVQALFTMPEFYDAKTRTGHIKSPSEFVVQTIRTLGLQSMDLSRIPYLLTQLGQTLFDPPNVGGWPGGAFWISASTMLGRFNFASQLTGDAAYNNGKTLFDPQPLVSAAGSQDPEGFVLGLADLFGITPSASTLRGLMQYVGKQVIDPNDPESKIRGLVHLILVSPEFQVS